MPRVKLMTYNMLHAPGDRLGALVEVVGAEAPDLLAAQEVNTYGGMMELSRELGMLPVWGPANAAEDTRDGAPLYEHLVLFTRWEPRLVRVHRGDRRAMFRPVLEVRLDIPGAGALNVFTVHFRAVPNPDEPYLKYRELGAFLAALSGAEERVVAMGDFNALPPGEEGGVAAGPERPADHRDAVAGGVVGAIVASGYLDSYRLANPYDGTPAGTLLQRPGARVDYIFVSSDLAETVGHSSIVDTEAVARASDHRPVVTGLDLLDAG